MEWSKEHVTSTFHICWGAQAALYYHYGIPKYQLDQRVHGVFEHTVDRKSSMLLRGADDTFWAPHSRNTENRLEDIEAVPELRVTATSREVGPYALMTDNGAQVFIMGHPEYDGRTLGEEYRRDLDAGKNPALPAHYYPHDDVTKLPIKRWQRARQCLLLQQLAQLLRLPEPRPTTSSRWVRGAWYRPCPV